MGSILVGAALLASDSRAGATVDLLFVGRNGAAIVPTDSVGALPGDTLTMALLVRNDQPLTVGVFSLNYDLDGDDELEVVDALRWAGLPFLGAPPIPPPIIITPTFVGSFGWFTDGFVIFELLPKSGGAFAGGYQMGTVVWQVNPGVNSDGIDILSGLFDPDTNGFGDAAFNDIANLVLFRSATVNLIPEPGTGCLLGFGVLALAWLRGRQR